MVFDFADPVVDGLVEALLGSDGKTQQGRLGPSEIHADDGAKALAARCVPQVERQDSAAGRGHALQGKRGANGVASQWQLSFCVCCSKDDRCFPYIRLPHHANFKI